MSSKEKKHNNLKVITHNSKGITLVALIVTIIVLLILAVVAINAVQDDGILLYAKNSTNKFQQAQLNEQDILNNYGNKITDTLKEKILPDEYKQLEYIQSTGTQYIDTEVYANNNMDIETKINVSNIGNTTQIIFGSRTSYQVNDYSVWAAFSYKGMVYGYGKNVETNELYPYEGQDVLLYTDKNTFYLKKTEEEIYERTVGYNTIQGTNSLLVFAGYMDDTIKHYIKNMKLYYFKFYENGELIRNFIPCYRKLDNRKGLYDIVEGKFYENQGTGDFIAGPEV